MAELNGYPWSGHAVLLGRRDMPGQNVEEVLRYFGKRTKAAREKLQAFVADGISMGQRDEFAGGGLKRVQKLAGDEEVSAYDDRTLGSADFVEQLKQEKEIAEKLDAHIPLPELIRRIAEFAQVDPKELRQRGRKKTISDTKGIICFLAARRLGYIGKAVAKALGITRSGVCRGASRGASLAADNPGKWGRLEGIINRSTASP
jgi:putative transposase